MSTGCHTSNSFALTLHGQTEKKRQEKEKTTPFGVNLVRSQVLYRVAWSPCGALWVLSIVQGYTTILLEPMGSDNERAGEVKAVLMGSAVNQDGRSGGLTVGIPARAYSLDLTRLQ